MKKVEVYPAGFKVYDDNDNLIGYIPDIYGEGCVYKDEEAFRDHHDEICYIPELSFEDDFMSVEDAKKSGETYNTIVEQIMDKWGEEYMLTEAQAKEYGARVYYMAEWACIDTYLAETFELDDLIVDDNRKKEGIFTQFQYDAVVNEMTPKEYAERSLSYEELIEFENEFDEAFVVDEDCDGDWSDNGLGDNARITYIDERRTGLVSCPEEFDCPDKFRKKNG